MRRITLRDIASESGVSVATVGRALHNNGRINENTRNAIIKKADELGYKPNRIASTLVKNTAQRIVFITPGCNVFFEEIIRGAQTSADELMDFGVHIDFLLQDSFFDSLLQVSCMKRLLAEKPDGIAIVPLHSFLLSASIDEALAREIPVITVNLDSKESRRLCYVGQDPVKTGAIIGTLFGKKLNNAGNIIILNGITEISTLKLRTKGFVDKLNERYPDIRIIETLDYVDDIEIAYEIAKRVIKDYKVDGIFANTAYGSVGVGKAIRDMDKSGLIMSVGYDTAYGVLELLDCNALNATVTQNPFMQGYYAVKLLYKILSDQTTLEREYNYTKIDIIVSREQYNLNESGSFYDSHSGLQQLRND